MSKTSLLLMFVLFLAAGFGLVVFGAVAVSNPPTVASAAPEEVAGTATTVPTETFEPTVTVTLVPTDTATPLPTETSVPLRKPDFSINGQIFIDLCARLEELGVPHNCPVVEHANVPLEEVEGEYFIEFLDYPGLGLFYQPGGEYFCGPSLGVSCTVDILMFRNVSFLEGDAPHAGERNIGHPWYLRYTRETAMESLTAWLDHPAVSESAKTSVRMSIPAIYFALGEDVSNVVFNELGMEYRLLSFDTASWEDD